MGVDEPMPGPFRALSANGPGDEFETKTFTVDFLVTVYVALNIRG